MKNDLHWFSRKCCLQCVLGSIHCSFRAFALKVQRSRLEDTDFQSIRAKKGTKNFLPIDIVFIQYRKGYEEKIWNFLRGGCPIFVVETLHQVQKQRGRNVQRPVIHFLVLCFHRNAHPPSVFGFATGEMPNSSPFFR